MRFLLKNGLTGAYLTTNNVQLILLLCFSSYDIMIQCWEENPKDRPTFNDLKEKFETMQNENVCEITSFLLCFKREVFKILFSTPSAA